MPDVVTANRLTDGIVVYLTPEGGWVEDIARAARAETKEDTCSIDVIRQAFAAADYDVKELIVALTMTDAFRYRRQVAN